jgi:N-acyl-L-homoserine lactone synthetase
MKVHVVTSANRSLYAGALDRMHQLRHQVFVEELGWSDLESKNGLEVDDFDGDDAVYLLACEDGECFGSVRMLPTWRRSMLSEIWPEFVTTADQIVGPDIWEWTRWCPGVLARRFELVKARKALFLASLEFAGSRNVRTYIAFCETRYFSQLEEIGWKPRPLGLPRPAGDGAMALGVIWEPEPHLLDETRRLFGADEPVLIEAPPPGSAGMFLQPWMLERLYGIHSSEEALAVEALLLRVGVPPVRGAARRLEAAAVMGRA